MEALGFVFAGLIGMVLGSMITIITLSMMSNDWED